MTRIMSDTTTASASAIHGEAAQWFSKLHSPACSAATRQAFATWLKADARHQLAYTQCRTLWLMSSDLKGDSEIKQELNAARQRVAELKNQTDSGRTKTSAWRKLAQIAAVVVLGLGVFFTTTYHASEEYATHTGEQRLVQLADGSTAMLNTDSKISVHFTRAKRSITLIKGEAYFDVSKDHTRPFEVTAAGSLVRAVGTEFNVALFNHAVNVDVTEGIVEFATTTANHPKPEVIAKINVGEGVTFHKGDVTAAIQRADVARISAWQARKIYFKNDTLADAVADYNRYSNEKIVVVDKALNQQRITGIFNLGDIDTFIFSLEQALEARVERRGGKILVMKKLATSL